MSPQEIHSLLRSPADAEGKIAALRRLFEEHTESVSLADVARRKSEARAYGYLLGSKDQHWMRRIYRTAMEYQVWLEGWREGQADLHAKKLAQEGRRQELERAMAAVGGSR